MPILGTFLKKAISVGSRLPVNKSKQSSIKMQEQTLRKLIESAQNTSFGEYYKFDKILKQKNIIDAFKSEIPIHDYNSIFRKWWYRSLNGEAYVCWPEKVKYFALSSGTSEASSKQIPVTESMIKSIRKTSIRQILSLAHYNLPDEFFEKGILMLGGSTHLQYNGTYYEGDLSGITAGNIPFWFQHFYKPGKRISKERDWTTKLEEITKNAHNWDIGVVVGVPAWIQILIEKIINHYNVENIHEIWPNLSIYTHGGVSFNPYKKGFEKLLGKPLTYIETYLASEGFIAYQSRPNTDSMEMVLNNGLFFEFIPFNEENFDENNNIIENPVSYNIDEVKENVEYALIISSCAGAWRYIIGDTLKFTSKEKHEIIITGRTKHFLNICGEHLSQENMDRAIELTSNQLNIDICEYTVTGIKHDSMFAHKWYVGTEADVSAQVIRAKIDENLKVLNDDYRVERIAAIKDVLVEIVSPNLFYQWMKSKGKEGGQNKFPRVLKIQQSNDWEEFIRNYK
ncbi:MAG: GH3 auxin-responsive promoter [Bacteroidetes bacterium GWE2_29_8]|nr:MAG: GH3 auxin-responsive promoter [Bacteroidetes bacterium GWE2_29_8]